MVSGSDLSTWRTLKALPAFAVTLWGVFAAHTISYRLTHRSAESRALRLAETGHSYWDVAASAAVAGLAIALVATVLFAWKERRSRRPSMEVGPGQLALMNVAGFVSMELVERLLSGAESQRLVTEPAFWLGIVASVAVACGNSLLLRGANRLGAALREATDTARRNESRRVVPPQLRTHRDLLGYVCWTRGPPLSNALIN